MADLKGQQGELRFTIQIKRAETGKVEEYELIGKVSQDDLKETENGSDTQHSGS